MAVEKQVNVVISAVDQFSGVLTGFGGSWKMIAAAAVAVEVAILAASVAAAKFAVDIGQDCFVAATDFHDAIYDVEAVASSFGTTGAQISGVLDELTNKFPATGKEGGEALQLIAQMGYGTEDQLRKVSDEAMTLSIATGTDLKTSAEATMATMNQFGISVDEVGRVTNLFAAVAFTSAATVSDLKEAMKYAGAEAALSGISMEVTAAAVGILRDKGLEASQAGTTFRMALSKLYKETDAGKESLKKYGLTYADVKPSVVGLTGVIEAFDGKILDAEDAMNIFGVRSKSMALLVNEGSESFKAYVKQVSDTKAAYEAAEIKLGKWSVVMKQVEGSMDLFKKTIAAELVPSLIGLVGKTADDGIRGVITQLMNMEKESGAIGQPMIDLFESLKNIVDKLFADAFGDVEGFYNYLADISNALSTNLEIISIWGAAFAEAFIGATDEGDELETLLHLVNAAIAALAIPVAAIHDLFVGFFYALNLGWDLAEAAFTGFNLLFTKGLLTIAKAIDSLPFVDMSKQIKGLEKDVEYWGHMLEGAFDTKPPELWMQKVGEAHAKGTQAIEKFGEGAKETYKKVEEETVNWGNKITEAGDKYALAKKELKKLAEGGPELFKTTEEWTKAVSEAEEEYKKAETELKKIVTEAGNLETAHSKAATEVVNWKEKLDKVTEKYEEAKRKAEEGGGATGKTTAEVTKLAVEVSKATEKYEEAKKSAEKTKIATETITGETLLWGKELLGVDKNTKAVAKTAGDVSEKITGASRASAMAVEEAKKWKDEVDRLDASYSSAQQAAAESGDSTGEAAQEAERLRKELIAAGLSWNEAKNRAAEMTASSKETTTAVEKTAKKLSEIEKFELGLETAKFKSDLKIAEQAAEDAASLIRTKIEWTAKIDIAGIEAAADVAVAESKVIEAAFSSVGETVAAISSGIGGLAGALSEVEGFDRWELMDLIEDQVEMQGKLVEAQVEMLAAQVELYEIKAKKMEGDKAEIQVDVIGDTEGWLKGLMKSLFDEIIVKARAEAFNCFGEE